MARIIFSIKVRNIRSKIQPHWNLVYLRSMKKIEGGFAAREWGGSEGVYVSRRKKAGADGIERLGLMEYCLHRRKELGWSQEDLGRKIGKGSSWVSWAENGGAVGLVEVERMLIALGVDLVQMKVVAPK